MWKEETAKSTLGPSYNAMKSSFEPSGKKGATFGSKRREKVDMNPGPGSYSNINVINMVKSKGASVRIGNTKRPDNFTKKDS